MCSIVVLLAACGIAGIAAVFVDVPLLAIYLYVILLTSGLAVTVVNASTVDLYPTSLRAMAVCVSLMMGRVGSVTGTNFVGLLLDDYCEVVFCSTGLILISRCFVSIEPIYLYFTIVS